MAGEVSVGAALRSILLSLCLLLGVPAAFLAGAMRMADGASSTPQETPQDCRPAGLPNAVLVSRPWL